ncbi:MAG: hypothetical protein ACJ8C4_03315 [Gemmataceae bacterium]
MNPMETTSVYWHFPMLIVTVSLVYSATRFEKWDQIVREAIFWGLRMTMFLAAIGVGLHVFAALDRKGLWIATGVVVVGLIIYYFVLKPRFKSG